MTGVSGHWRLGNRPALDGVRGLAVALVVLEHAGYLPGPAGSFGVTVFFVLSGVLITRVIIETRDAGRWSMRTFLWRRAVRLIPALVVTTGVMLVVWAALGNPVGDGLRHTATTLLYVENWTRGTDPGSFMAHTWSLAVEEQFYLVWPLVLPWFLRSRNRVTALGAIVVLGAALRTQDWVILLLGPLAYSSTPTNAYALLAGAAVAIAAPKITRAAPAWTGALVAVALVATVLLVQDAQSAPTTWAPLAAAAALLLVWAGLNNDQLLQTRGLRFLGRISYALYLWHWPVLMFTGTYAAGTLTSGAVALLCLIPATASTFLIEEPLRRRYANRHADSASPAELNANVMSLPAGVATKSYAYNGIRFTSVPPVVSGS